jgi:hypothetical protein
MGLAASGQEFSHVGINPFGAQAATIEPPLFQAN